MTIVAAGLVSFLQVAETGFQNTFDFFVWNKTLKIFW